MLSEVADGVWVRQSEWIWSNATVVRGDDGLVLVDPGISGADLEELADEVDALGVPVVAGFSTHLHWDHLLWHERFGDVPRYAMPSAAEMAPNVRELAGQMAQQSAEGVPVDLIARTVPLPDDHSLPGVRAEVLAHDAHAIGHAALLLADRGVLVAGDMYSDVLVPMLDPRRPAQLEAYDAAVDRLAAAAADVTVLVPGHGAVATGAEVRRRFEADRAYIDALKDRREVDDPRLTQGWVADLHRGNQERTWT